MISNIKIVIIHTHPIQYNVPFFRELANRFKIKVLYTWTETHKGYFDSKFNKLIKWDIPLIEGYDYEFVKNISPSPGPNKLIGIINPDLLKRIKKISPDVILVYGWKNWSHLRTMALFKNKIPILFRGDSTLLDYREDIKNRMRAFVLKQVYKYIDYALYVGTENKKYFKAVGLKDEQLVFVPHAIENDRFYDKDGEKENLAEAWRQELGIPQKAIVFLYAGKFEPKKNIGVLIRAFKALDREYFRLILVGNGVEEERLRKMADNDKRIIFLPFQNQSRMPIVYRLADVFVLPSAWGETWGLAVNEAMASRRAIICSDKVGCATDLIKQGINGYIFPYHSSEQLTYLMAKFSKVKAQKFGLESEKIIHRWSYEEGIKNIEKLLQTIV